MNPHAKPDAGPRHHSPAQGPHAAATARVQARAWWAARTQRERTMLSVAALLMLAALTWSLGVRPALDTIARLHTQLPQLRAEAMQIDAIIAEAHALQRTQTARIDATSLGETLRDDLHRAGLQSHADVQAAGPGTPADQAAWEVTVHDAPAATTLRWISGVPFRLHVRVHGAELARSRVDGRDRPGHITGRIVLLAPEQTP